jgi:hypothetical protein
MDSRIDPDEGRRAAADALAELGVHIRRETGQSSRGWGRGHRRRRVARVAWQAAKPLARKSYARRRPLAPFVATFLLYLAGVVLAHSTHGANTVALFAALGGLLVWWRSRQRTWREMERRYAAAVYLAATGWLQAAAVIGAGPPMPGILLVGATAAAVPWWWHHRIRPQEPEHDDRIVTWDGWVACQNGALPGSWLRGIRDVENGWSATIALPAGKLTTAAAIAAADRIASAYGLAATSVVIEAPATGEQNRAQLLVLTRNPLQQVLTFPGPQLDYQSGLATFGVHADGTPAQWRLFEPGSGGCHGLIAGTTGSGKSRLVDLLCATVRLSGLSVLWLADPENGASVPDWQDSADYFAGTIPEIRRMLQAAVRVMEGRGRRRSREKWADEQGRQRTGRGSFTPTHDEPLLVIVIEESPDVLADPVCQAAVAKILKKGRKHGVVVYLVTQVPSLAELGGNLTIRSMASSTNVVMFRTSDKLSKQMGIPGDLAIDPASINPRWPDGSSTAGMGYLAAAGSRISPMRAQYVKDPYYWATLEADIARLEPSAVDDAGPHYGTSRERRAAGDDELEDTPPVQLVRIVDELADDQASEAGGITALRPAIELASRVSTRDRILALLAQRGADHIHTGVVAEHLQAPLSTVSQTLRRLEQQGHARQVRRGVWANVDPTELTADHDGPALLSTRSST